MIHNTTSVVTVAVDGDNFIRKVIVNEFGLI